MYHISLKKTFILKYVFRTGAIINVSTIQQPLQ